PWRSKIVVGAAADYFFTTRLSAATSALMLNAIPIDRETVSRKSIEPVDLWVGNHLHEESQRSGLHEATDGTCGGLTCPCGVVVRLELRRDLGDSDAGRYLGGAVGESHRTDGALGAHGHPAAARANGATGETHLAQRL
ncbi:MAG: hypothetical protein EB015_02200, partial [Methylocystaceae bacterium]|nr:hypothetical protein [Methylocystaceae bacterium]